MMPANIAWNIKCNKVTHTRYLMLRWARAACHLWSIAHKKKPAIAGWTRELFWGNYGFKKPLVSRSTSLDSLRRPRVQTEEKDSALTDIETLSGAALFFYGGATLARMYGQKNRAEFFEWQFEGKKRCEKYAEEDRDIEKKERERERETDREREGEREGENKRGQWTQCKRNNERRNWLSAAAFSCTANKNMCHICTLADVV